MANYDDIEYGPVNLGLILSGVTINTLTTLSRGLMTELVSPFINDFNKMNHDFMLVHMMRNAYEKTITLGTVGENAYTDGNPDIQATASQYPTYTHSNNYTEFISSVNDGEKRGLITTRVNTKDGIKNKYFDANSNDTESQIEYSSSVDRNSILFKTQRLLKLNKLKTIISEYHTDSNITYNGQIGSEYGESHGRNLLTKEAENGTPDYDVLGYENPYCRVWTHHHKYDKIARTMRANGVSLNNWKGFEWNSEDKGHYEDSTVYGDGEHYDYAWRGKHNQDRRYYNSALDPQTGLVKITPQYRGGGESNRHTKECMFSIENLAWKDYDPYSFEEALSWEQRGPLGGRIMWFPPYGLEILETTNAKWNSSEFIGRGEPIYTYINTERSGTLNFLMLTDHPSSIDYASWWDDNGNITGVDNGQGNSEKDYLRYFAGCSNGDNGLVKETEDDPNDSKTGGLIVKPTPMTDEFLKPEPPLIKGVKEEEVSPDVSHEDKNSIYVEFFVFFPNNYSGVRDLPSYTKTDETQVNAIAYLLGGRNAQKHLVNGKIVDNPLYLTSKFDPNETDYVEFTTTGLICKDLPTYRGYEMGRGSITFLNYKYNDTEYIQGGKKQKTYEVDEDKTWFYRVDHIQTTEGNYVGDDKTLHDGQNLLNEKISYYNLYDYFDKWVDDKSCDLSDMKLNYEINEDIKQYLGPQYPDSLYSFAEVAAAIYQIEDNNTQSLRDYLLTMFPNRDRINKLVDIFTNTSLKLKKVTCKGYATTQGPSNVNYKLYKNRANTIINWLKGTTIWRDGCYDPKGEQVDSSQIKNVKPEDLNNVNGKTSKMFRCAHCIIEYDISSIESTNSITLEDVNIEAEGIPNHNFVGFRYIDSVNMPNGQVWRYYEKDGSIKYYEQESGGDDNYENKTGEDDIIVSEPQIKNIFNEGLYKPNKVQIIKENPNYRGLYNERGFYINTFDYSQEDEVTITDFSYTENKTYENNSYVYDNGRLYVTKETFTTNVSGKTREQIWNDYKSKFNDISNSMSKYIEGDYVLVRNGGNEDFYICLSDYYEKYPDFGFNVNDWDEVTVSNISDAIVLPYKYVNKTYQEAVPNDIIYEDNVFELCIRIDKLNIPTNDVENWTSISVTAFQEGEFFYNLGDYMLYENNLYICIDDNYYTDEFNPQNWDMVPLLEFCTTCIYNKDDIIKYNNNYFKARRNIDTHYFTTNLSIAIPRLVKNSDNPYGKFDGSYNYKVDDYCVVEETYYRSKVNFSEKTVQKIPFQNAFEDGSWEIISNDSELNKYEYTWETMELIKKASAVLCYTVDELVRNISGDADNNFNKNDKTHDSYQNIWKYGITNNGFVTPETVNESTNLVAYAIQCEQNSLHYDDESAVFRFTENEEEYIQQLNVKNITTFTAKELRQSIILYRILDSIKKIKNDELVRDVCATAPETDKEMKEKNKRKDYSETEGCNNVWVDRGDGMLIQECYIDYKTGGNKPQERFNPNTGKGEWNKLRYDQEYHFYKQWIEEHPLMYEKLQEKIKYFNPAFHSMTPEGFNARCTFLQQCTRQGNTKTMSDIYGVTANNLAFGRAPYCVLRLGDFYNQMIIIDNISFDYNVADGVQWDLNTEGNGVQPMLCKVSISFKFIGGGDITGPVQRLQNAMSFNYYANTSFYDNRADRVQYQPTNWTTMGGADNNGVDWDKSYAYVTKLYEPPVKENIMVPVP